MKYPNETKFTHLVWWVFALLTLSSAAYGEGDFEELPRGTLGTRFGFIFPSLTMDLSVPKGGDATMVKYKPHSPSRASIGFSYANFGVSGSVSTPLKPDDIQKYGTSSVTDLQFRFYGRKRTYDFFYQYYSGYYLENSEAIDNTLTASSPRILRPDIRNMHYGVQVLQNFDWDDFSLSSAFDQGAVQTRSNGGWLVQGAYNHYDIRGDAPFVPSQLTSQYGEFGYFRGGAFDSLRIGGGYGHNFVYKQWFFSIVLLGASGQQHQVYELNGVPYDRWVPNNGLNAKSGIGYNGKKYYFGFHLIADAATVPIGNAQASMNTIEGNLYFGFRSFDMNFTLLDRLSDWLFGATPASPKAAPN